MTYVQKLRERIGELEEELVRLRDVVGEEDRAKVDGVLMNDTVPGDRVDVLEDGKLKNYQNHLFTLDDLEDLQLYLVQFDKDHYGGYWPGTKTVNVDGGHDDLCGIFGTVVLEDRLGFAGGGKFTQVVACFKVPEPIVEAEVNEEALATLVPVLDSYRKKQGDV